jgi:hypothetical protein
MSDEICPKCRDLGEFSRQGVGKYVGYYCDSREGHPRRQLPMIWMGTGMSSLSHISNSFAAKPADSWWFVLYLEAVAAASRIGALDKRDADSVLSGEYS